MKTYFMNDGDFDVRAMLTMGVSAKPSSEAIGYFGTGFKYAIAIILRMGGKVTVSTKSGVYAFTARTESIRGAEFQIVYCNDREAGFTTRLGINWQPWQAFRELYCNAKDESGVISDTISDNYDTVICVDSVEIAKCYQSREDYFLDSTPAYAHPECEIHDVKKPFIYYRGIAVANAMEDALYTYNITRHIELTEDRTVRFMYAVNYSIQKALQSLTDASMLRKILSNGAHAEAKLGFDTDWPTSEEFVHMCRALIKTDAGLCESARVHASKLADEAGDWPEFTLNAVQQKQLAKAKIILASIDVYPDQYEIKTVTGLGEGVMGRAHEGVIYLSEMPFNMGTKQLASTLMEEWVHCKTGAHDFDRTMQNWLFDKILSLAENIVGEPI